MSTKFTNQTTLLFTHYGDEWIRGSERCLLDLLTHLDRNKFKPVLWCNSKRLAKEAQHLDLPIYQSNFPLLFGWNRPRFNINAYIKLVKQGKQLVDQFNIKLIHANSGAPCQWLNLVARSRGIPLLAHLHARYPLRDRLSLGLHQVAMAVGVSPPVIDQLHKDGMTAEQLSVIPNGVDIARLESQPARNLRVLLNISRNDFLMVSTGSLIYRKGFDLLINSVFRLKSQGVPVKLVIIGEGPERLKLQKQIQALHLQNTVHLLGERTDVYGLLKEKVDLFVSGAREEVFGLCLAEAALAGIPVVAPAVGGIPGVILNQKTGMLVPPEDTDTLTTTIKQLYFNASLRREMGLAGRAYIKNSLTIEQNVSQFERLYHQLLTNPNMQMRWLSHWQFRTPFQKTGKQLLNLSLSR